MLSKKFRNILKENAQSPTIDSSRAIPTNSEIILPLQN